MMLRAYSVGDPQSRLLKARKIETLLGGALGGLRLLDLGAGSGLLGDYFEGRGAIVTAADRDPSSFRGGVPFVRIEGCDLPFEDDAFDIVIFNHVIEHVGGRAEQRQVLSEIARVLRPHGSLYLAVPSKWALIEPHFRLPLLGALPRRCADVVVRLCGKGERYDCYPLALPELRQLLRGVFAEVNDRTADAANLLIRHEMHPYLSCLGCLIPPWLARPFYPTLVMVCGRPHAPS